MVPARRPGTQLGADQRVATLLLVGPADGPASSLGLGCPLGVGLSIYPEDDRYLVDRDVTANHFVVAASSDGEGR